MAFKPRKTDNRAPMGFRRFIKKSEYELNYASGLIRRDYEHCTSEQLLNIIVEMRRRGQVNQLGSLLDWLTTMNSIPVHEAEEYRIVPDTGG